MGQDDPQPPAAPSGLQVTTEAGSLEVDLDWDDVESATGYRVRWRTAEPGGQLNEGAAVAVSEAEISVAGTGAWVVRVQACNDAGCGSPSAQRFEIEPAPEPEPMPEPETEPVPDTENAQAQTEVTVSVQASTTAPFAGDNVNFSAVIAHAPDGETPTYQWELGYGGDFWVAAGSDPTFSYLPHQPETASVRVTVRYPSGVAATSSPLSVTWRPFVPKPQPPTTEGARSAAEPVSVSIRFDEDESVVGRPARLVAVVANLPAGEQPRYRWEMNLGGRWWTVGSERAFPWSTSIPETVRFRVTVFYGDGESVTSDELELAWAGGRARSTRDVTSAATSTVLISNSGQSLASNSTLGVDRAQAFTTGSNSAGYKLTSVEIAFASTGALTGYGVKILSDNSGSPGSTEVGTLSTLSSVTSGLNEFSHSGTGIDLDAGTTYHVVLDMTATSSRFVRLTVSDDEDSGGAIGWSIGNTHHIRSVDDSGVWSAQASQKLQIVVNGYAKTTKLVGNTGQSNGTNVSFSSDLAQAFTTGSNSTGYKLTNLQIVVAVAGTVPPHEAKIMNDDGSGAPGSTTVGTLTSPTSFSGLSEFTGDVNLDPNTTYHVVLDRTAGTNSVSLTSTSSNGEDAGGAAGWSIGNGSHWRATGDGGGWRTNTVPLKIIVNGFVNPPAPTLDSAEIDATELVLTFDKDLDTASGTAAGAFTISEGGGAAQAATAITIAARTITLTVPAVAHGQTVTVSYTKPATSPLQGADGAEVDAFTDQAVTNGTALISNNGQTSVTGTSTSLGLDQAQGFTTGSNSAGYKLTGVEISFISAGAVSNYTAKIMAASSGLPGSTEVGTLTTLSSVTSGLNEFHGDVDLDPKTTYYVVLDVSANNGSRTLHLTASDNEDSGGAAGWSIANAHHTRNINNSLGWSASGTGRSLKIVVNGYAITPPALASAEVDGTELVLTFDGDLDTGSGTAAGAFTIKEGSGAAQAATAITIADRTVTLTVPAVTAGQRVTVSYTKPATNPLEGAGGVEVDAFTDQAVTNSTSIALVGNTGQLADNDFLLNGDRAQAFTTGSNSTGYKLTSVQIAISVTGSPSAIPLKIMNDDGSGAPGSTTVGTLTSPLGYMSGIDNEFTGDVDLQPNTTYHVVMDLTATISDVSWRTTESDDEDSGGAAGWSIGNRSHERAAGNSIWGANTNRRLKIIVNGYEKPPLPAVDSAEIDGATLVLTFDTDLDTASDTAAGAFEIKVDGGSAQAATAITIADRTVTLTVPAVTPGQTVTVSYTKPATNPLKGTDDSEAAEFTDQAVTNNTVIFVLIANTGAPNTTAGGGLSSDRAQPFTTGSHSAGYRLTSLKLAVQAGGSPSYSAKIAFDTGAGPGNATVATLGKPSSLATGFGNEFTGEVDLLPSTTYFLVIDSEANTPSVLLRQTNGDDEDSGGAAGWSIGDGQHRRNWDATGAWTGLAQALKIVVNGYVKAHPLNSAEIDGDELVLTYDGNLDTASATAAGAFTISVDGGAAQAATAIVISGKTVTLTVPAVTDQQTVTVSYSKPDTNPLKDSNAQPVDGFTDRAVTHDTSNRYSTSKVASNLGLGADNLLSGAWDFTTLFTTGAHSDGYKLSAVEIKFEVGTGAQPTYNVELWSMLANVPLTKLATFDKPTTLTDGTNRFTLSTAHDLTASTTYVIVYDQTTAGSNIRPILTESDDEESGKAAGWSIANRSHNRLWSHTSANWSGQDNVLKLALYGQPAEPTTSALVGNNSQADHATLNFGLFSDRAQSFTTGANSTGYRLKSVQVGVATAGTPTGYKVKIAEDSGSGPGADVATLTNPSSLTVGLNSFTGDVDLAPSTTYYIVTDLPRNNAAAWKRTSSNNEDSGGAAGWSIGDRFWARNFGSAGAWAQSPATDILKVVVNGYAKPTSDTATADAGEDQTVQTGTTVTLDGSGSATTKAGATLTYAWTQTSGPTVTLSDASAQQPTFTPAYRADYVFSLAVDDGDGLSAADTVTIAVRPPLNPATAPCPIPDEDATVDATVISTPTTTASAVTWGATTTGGAGSANLYFCSPDGIRELVGSAVAAPTTARKTGLDSGTKYWVGALKTRTSDSTVSWSGWIAATTSGGASIVDVRIVSTPRWDADDDGVPETYGLGDKIWVVVIWSQNVSVTGDLGNVRMRLDVGSDDSDLTNSRQVAKAVGTSGARVRFEYTVATNDEDNDGVWVQTASATSDQIIFLTGTAIIKNAVGGTNVNRTRSGLPTSGDPKHKVDHQYASTPPAFPNATETLTIDENSAEGATVGTVTATDADGDTLYYSLRASGDHARFTIGETGSDEGTIKVGPGQNFDFETAPNSYTVTVDVTDREDSDGNAETPPYTTDDTVVVTITVTDVDEPPAAPTITAVTGVSTTSVTVTWTAPTDTGAEAITDYDLRYYAGSAEPTDAADWIEEGETDGHTHTGTGTTTTITMLDEGADYQVQVRAEGEGEGAWSATASGATLDPPAAPRNFWAQASSSFVTLRWSNPGDSTITQYQLRQSTDGGTTWTAWARVAGSNASTTSHNVFSLTNGTYYDFELRSVHSIGTSSVAAVGAMPTSSGIFGPSNLRATAADTQVTLSWTPQSGATRQRVRHRATGGTWSSFTVLGGGAGTHTETNLTNGTTYRFEVQTGQTSTWDKASTIEATPTERAVAPGNFTALPGNRSISLSWDNPSDNAITKYEIRQSTDGGMTWNPDWTDITGSDKDTTSHSLSNLTNGTTYTIELRASRGTVAGAASSATATPNLPPPAPSGLSSTAGDGVVDLSWTDPSDSNITKYQYRHKAGSGNWSPDWTDIASSGATTTSYQVTGLTNDTTYTIEVRAVRSGPLYGAASSTTATPRPTVPAAPASFAATAGDGRVDLAWTDPSNSQISVYQVRQRQGTNAWTSWADISGSSATTTSHRVTGLTNDTGYTFEVRARAGTVTFGPASSATATPRPTPPAAPASFAATAGDGRVDLAWTDPSNSQISRYQSRHKPDGGNWTVWAVITGSSATTTSHRVTGLTNDTEYTFEVRARAGNVTFGTASSATATPRPAAPPAPTNLRADVGNTEITLRWNNPNDNRISKYRYRVSDDDGATWDPDWTVISTSSATTTSYKVTGLINDTEYKFEVQARRGTVTTGTASSVTQTPRPPAPPAPSDLTADPGNTKVTLNWTDPSDTLISVYQYRQSTDGGATWSPGWTEITGSDDMTVSHEVTGLTNDTTYTFEVRSRRGTATTGAASRVAVTPKDPPPAPRALWANPSTGQIVLKWADPGDATITHYEFRQSTDGGATWSPDWGDIPMSSATTTSLTRTGLTDGTTYYDFEVRAVRGESNAGTAAAIGATPNTGPGPGTLSATAADAQVVLSWGEGPSTVDRYRVRHRASGGSFGSWTDISGRTNTTHTQSSLTNGTTYRFEVQAGTSATNFGPGSAIEAKPTERAAAPLNFTALPGDRTITLSWTDPNDSNITKYEYRYKVGSGNWNPDWTVITGAGATTTMHTLSNLTNGTTYTVEVRASRGTTAGAASSTTATPNLPPGRPTGLSATAGDAKVDLSWTNPSDSSIVNYQYRVSDDSGMTWDPDWTDTGTATTTSLQVTGLTNDTTYTIELRAARSGRLYGPAASRTSIPRPTAPPAPTGFTATAGDGDVELAWADPSDTLITKYQYRQKVGTGNWVNWTDIPGAATTMHTVTGLTNDTTYSFQVRARRGTVTHGPPSSSATATPRPTPPAAPSGLGATAGDGRVTLSWTDPSDSLISKYRYRVSDDGGTTWGNWTVISTSSSATTMHTVTGLTNDTDYSFELQARRGTVTVGPAASATATTRPAAPPAPVNLRAVVGDTEITLRWNNPNDSRISVYQFRQSIDDGVNWNPDWIDISGSGSSTISHTVTGLTNDTQHKFEVRARRGTVTHGAASSVTQTPRPAPPPAPTGLTADPGNAQVTLNWTDPMDSDIRIYQIRQKAGSAAWTTWADISGSTATTKTHSVSMLTNDTRYRFEIRAVRGALTSGLAAGVNVTPKAPPPAPRNLRATPANGQIVVDWTNPNDSTITKYEFRQSTDGGTNWNPDWGAISGSGSATTSLTRTGLTDGTYHDIEVRAVRGSANAGTAAAIGAEPLSTGPAAPAGLRATAADGQVTLSWSEGGSTVTGYRVRHRPSGGSWSTSWTTISGRATTTHTVSPLSNGTAVRFEVAAGTSATSFGPASAIEATPTERPAAPVNLVPYARPAYVYLTWDDPNDPLITEYQFRRSTDGGSTWSPNWTKVVGSGATTTWFNLATLLNGTTYTIEVRAVRGARLGVEGRVTATPRTPPSPPTGFTATSGDNEVVLGWTNPGDASISKYQARHQANGETNWTDWVDIDGTSAAHTVTGLTNDTTYTFQLRAVRDRDNAGGAASATATPKPPPPAAVSGLMPTTGATPRDGGIALSWTNPNDPRISRYEYRVQRDGQSVWRPNWTEVPGSSDSTASYTVTGLLNDTTYTVEVRAVRGADTAGDEASVTIKTPKPAPRGLIARADDGQVHLSWTDPGDDGITKYQFRQKAGTAAFGGWTDIIPSDQDTVAHTVSSLANGTTFTFEVRALGTSPQEGVAARIESTPIDISSVPPAPTEPRAVAGNGQVRLSWTNPQDETITKYQFRHRLIAGTLEGAVGNAENWEDIPDSDANTTSYTVPELDNDNVYQFDVRAVYGTTDFGAVTSMIATPKRPVSTSSSGGGGGGGGGGGARAQPSDEEFEWNVTRDIEALDEENDFPTGLWSDGVMLWVVENAATGPDRLFVYALEDGARQADLEFEFERRNRFAHGIWSDGEVVWIADAGQDKLFAYRLDSGERLEERDYTLDERNRDARGIWSDGEVIYVLDTGKDALFAYDVQSGELDAEYPLDRLNRSPRGIWSDGVTIWVSDDGAKRLLAYRLVDVELEGEERSQVLQRHEAEEFTFRSLLSAGNSDPRGIWSDGEVIYVADSQDDRVYSYNMPDAIDARLASLTLSEVELEAFSANRFSYAGVFGHDVAQTTVVAEPLHEGGTVAVTPEDADGNPENGHQVAIEDGLAVNVTVTSEDGDRTQVYTVVFKPANRAPLSGDVPPLELTAGGEPIEVTLSNYFSDPDGDPLTYTLGEPTDANVVSLVESNGVLSVTPLESGATSFELSASDGELRSESVMVEVGVEAVPAVVQAPEVRIGARRVVNERVEFGLQVRAADGAWQPLILPPRRFLPADAELDRWLVSTPIEVGADDPPGTLRIAARQLASGSVEFALLVRLEEGGWSARLLPMARFLHSDAALDHWLYSTPLSSAEPP